MKNQERINQLRQRAESMLKKEGIDPEKSIDLRDVTQLLEELSVHQIELEMQNAELERSQQDLMHEKQKYQDLYDYAPNVYFTLNKTGNIIQMNYAAADFLGRPRDYFRFNSLFPFLADDYRTRFRKHLSDAFTTKEKQSDEMVFVTPANNRMYTKMHSHVYYDSENKETLCRVSVSEIVAEHLRREKQLAASEKRYRELAESISEGIFYLKEGRIDYANTALGHLFGYHHEEMIGMKLEELARYEIRAWFRQEYSRKTQGHASESIEVECVRFDGSTFWAEMRMKKSTRDDAVFGVLSDISKRKREEEALKQSEDHYRKLFRNNYSVMLLIDPTTGAIEDANQAACEYYGYSYTKLTQMSLYQLCVDDRTQIDEKIYHASKQQSHYFMLQQRLASDEIRHVEIYSGKVITDGKTRIYSIVHDIEERVKAKKQIETERTQFLSLLDSIPEIIYVADINTYEILFANKYLRNQYREPIIGRKCYEVLHDKKEMCSFCSNEQLLKNNEPYFWEYYNNKTQQYYYVIDKAIQWPDRRKVRFEMAMNITNRKLAEKALKESERELKQSNAAKDKFFSIIGHDLKVPLGALTGFSELLLNGDLENPAKAYKFTRIIHDSSKRVSRLLENLLEWARMQTGTMLFDPDYFDLAEDLQEVLDLFNDSAQAKHIQINNQLKEETKVWADYDMIQTVMRNLLSNAIKFTPKGGHITLTSQPASTPDYMQFLITDTGKGIEPGRLNKLFQIDESTTTPGIDGQKGTGLGLILCKEFVERNHGEIGVRSTLGKGSTFYFTLPVSRDAAPDEH